MKKGFTLVELLAVIVVLAILSLVAIPIIGSVIDSGKESATENSAKFYIDEVEDKFTEWVIEGIPTELAYTLNGSGNIVIDVVNLAGVLNLEGTAPVAGVVEINNDYTLDDSYFGYVMSATLEYENGYVAKYIYHTESNYSGDRAEIKIENK